MKPDTGKKQLVRMAFHLSLNNFIFPILITVKRRTFCPRIMYLWPSSAVSKNCSEAFNLFPMSFLSSGTFVGLSVLFLGKFHLET